MQVTHSAHLHTLRSEEYFPRKYPQGKWEQKGALPKSFLLQNSRPFLFQSQVGPNGGVWVFVAGVGASLGQLLTVGRSSEHVWRTLAYSFISSALSWQGSVILRPQTNTEIRTVQWPVTKCDTQGWGWCRGENEPGGGADQCCTALGSFHRTSFVKRENNSLSEWFEG